MAKNKTSFKRGSKIASQNGKNSKRTVSITHSIIKIGAMKSPAKRIKEIEIKTGIKPKDKKNADMVAAVLYANALDGNIQAIKEIGDRTDGKAKQQIEISGELDTGIHLEEVQKLFDNANKK